MRDLNSRPFRCKRTALPTELIAQITAYLRGTIVPVFLDNAIGSVVKSGSECILLLMIEMHSVITGKVQGVRYRTYVQESATTLGLVGYVKNLSDGTVEVVAQGMPDTLKDFVEYLNEGSLLSKVEGVSVDWRSVSSVYGEFSIVY